MRLCDVAEGINLVDGDLELALRDHLEKLLAVLLQLGARAHITEEDRPHDAEVLGAESKDTEGLNGTRLDDDLLVLAKNIKEVR